eukprot:GDKI01002181.1.p1 GENE.GDKI01002181.1~~GDKI01002181.1.p1  ORF type:complete len:330 (-),score=99.54 GDKI01002181.1:362-1300(-)
MPKVIFHKGDVAAGSAFTRSQVDVWKLPPNPHGGEGLGLQQGDELGKGSFGVVRDVLGTEPLYVSADVVNIGRQETGISGDGIDLPPIKLKHSGTVLKEVALSQSDMTLNMFLQEVAAQSYVYTHMHQLAPKIYGAWVNAEETKGYILMEKIGPDFIALLTGAAGEKTAAQLDEMQRQIIGLHEVLIAHGLTQVDSHAKNVVEGTGSEGDLKLIDFGMVEEIDPETAEASDMDWQTHTLHARLEWLSDSLDLPEGTQMHDNAVLDWLAKQSYALLKRTKRNIFKETREQIKQGTYVFGEYAHQFYGEGQETE